MPDTNDITPELVASLRADLALSQESLETLLAQFTGAHAALSELRALLPELPSHTDSDLGTVIAAVVAHLRAPKPVEHVSEYEPGPMNHGVNVAVRDGNVAVALGSHQYVTLAPCVAAELMDALMVALDEADEAEAVSPRLECVCERCHTRECTPAPTGWEMGPLGPLCGSCVGTLSKPSAP